jgi:ribosomal protein L44E
LRILKGGVARADCPATTSRSRNYLYVEMEKALRSASSRGHGISIFELPEEQASIFQEACVVYEGNQRSDLSALEELAQGKQAMHRTLSNSRTTDDFAQESKKSVTHYQETLFDCNTCGSSFFNNAAFRAHCQSEWHVHNVRLRANNKAPVTNQEYTRVQDLLSNPPSRRNKKKKKKKKGHNNSTSADAKAAMESVDGSLQEEGEEWNDDDDDNWWSDDQEVEEEEDTEEGKGDIGSFAVGFTTGMNGCVEQCIYTLQCIDECGCGW